MNYPNELSCLFSHMGSIIEVLQVLGDPLFLWYFSLRVVNLGCGIIRSATINSNSVNSFGPRLAWLLSQAGNFKKGKKFGILHKLHLTSCNVRLLDSSPTSTWAWYIKVTEINDYYNLYSLKICMNEHEQWQHPGGGGGYLLKTIHSSIHFILKSENVRLCPFCIPFGDQLWAGSN